MRIFQNQENPTIEMINNIVNGLNIDSTLIVIEENGFRVDTAYSELIVSMEIFNEEEIDLEINFLNRLSGYAYNGIRTVHTVEEVVREVNTFLD